MAYSGGQKPIVHLEADLQQTVNWANTQKLRWAFTLGNAASKFTPFFNDLKDLKHLNWKHIANTNFSDPEVKEHKWSEFLLHRGFSWQLVRRIGVYSNKVKGKVEKAIQSATHKPPVVVVKDWYY